MSSLIYRGYLTAISLLDDYVPISTRITGKSIILNFDNCAICEINFIYIESELNTLFTIFVKSICTFVMLL
jgi:hypothetical protein